MPLKSGVSAYISGLFRPFPVISGIPDNIDDETQNKQLTTLAQLSYSPMTVDGYVVSN